MTVMEAEFSGPWVSLRLSKEEFIFAYWAMHGVTDNDWLDDVEFRSLMGISRDAAQAFLAELSERELQAKEAGTHWAPISAERAVELRTVLREGGEALEQYVRRRQRGNQI